MSPDVAPLVTLGEAVQLDAVATDADGATVADVRFVCQSSRPGVVRVDTTGLATAEGPGEATITATRTVSATSDVATFSGLWLDRAAADYTLGATLGGAMSVTSAPFTVTLTLDEVSLGNMSTCGVDSAGSVVCWGRNGRLELGGDGRIAESCDGGMASTATPVAVSGGAAWTSISSGTIHTCGVTAGGQGRCWGSNSNGHLGDGTEVDSPRR